MEGFIAVIIGSKCRIAWAELQKANWVSIFAGMESWRIAENDFLLLASSCKKCHSDWDLLKCIKS